MNKAFKYRIYPNQRQETLMMKTFGCTRFVYNALLEARKEKYTLWVEQGKQDGEFDASLPKVSELKQTNAWFSEVDSLALSNSVMDFNSAMKNFFDSRNGGRKGNTIGFPKKKKRGIAHFAYRTCNQGGNIRFSDDTHYIKLPKMGWVRVVMHRALPYGGEIKNVTVSKTKSGEFYVSLSVNCHDENLQHSKIHNSENLRVVGLDMSLPKFCVSSDPADDEMVVYTHNYRKEEKRLARLQRMVSRKKKGSANRNKAKQRLAVLSEKVARRREEFCKQTALYFARKYDVVVLEDLDMRAMSQTLRNGKSVMDLGWGKFRHWLEYEAFKFDTVVLFADRWYPSSKRCNACGTVHKGLKLSDRKMACSECGTITDRDRNAAYNLRDYFKMYMNRTVGAMGTAHFSEMGNACGDGNTTLRDYLRVASVKEAGTSQNNNKTEAAKSLV